ncbi:hypothetical protein L7F22_015883 [Adiantum nelumboides]|nr:hypothetical protein [Adiantum nelumboides]
MKATTGQEESVVVGLTENGLLAAGDKTLARDATSFVATKTHVIWTTTAHEARFLALASLNDPSAAPQTETLSRRVERGSRIVCAVPASMSLVLQMPRGNLETICPRPLVLERVRKDLDERRYRRALTTCRTHRIDLNLLHDHDSEALLAHMEDFVDLVDNAEYMELFLSNFVMRCDVDPVPGGTRSQGESRETGQGESRLRQHPQVLDRKQSDGHVYINTILTTFVRRRRQTMKVLLRCSRSSRNRMHPWQTRRASTSLLSPMPIDSSTLRWERTTSHCPSWSPSTLPRAIAGVPAAAARAAKRRANRKATFPNRRPPREKSKGPRLAPQGCSEARGGMFLPEALTYLRKHTLYWDALEFISKDGKEYEQAAILFCNVRKWGKAIEAYIAAGQWRLAMTLVSSQPKATIEGVARRAIEKLRADQRYSEAATLSLEYLTNEVDDTVDLLLLARDWAGATRCAASRDRADLVQTVIWPAAAEAAADLIEEVHNDVAIQFSKQIERLAELRRKEARAAAGLLSRWLQRCGADDSASVMTGTSGRECI